MSIRFRLLTGAIAILAVSGLAIALLLTNIGSTAMEELAGAGEHALRQRALGQLESVRSAKAAHIENLFTTIRSQVVTFSSDLTVIEAARNFRSAFFDVADELGKYPEDVEQARKLLEVDDVGPHYLKNEAFKVNEAIVPDYTARPISQYIPKDRNAVILHSLYIHESGNPNRIGEKHLLDANNIPCEYNRHHLRYHPVIRHFLETFHYYDIFIVDPDTGHIVYSVFKEKDFATSLLTGPYSNTNFARCFVAARDAGRAGDRDFVSLVDFEPYEPSYNAPAAFTASPIFDGDTFLGVLMFQMPVDEINRIMLSDKKWKDVGLGETGETYLVAKDLLMRSPSRFAKQGENNVLLTKVDTEAVRKASKGEAGAGVIKDYRGAPVLSAWQPLSIAGLNYVLLAEIDESEALAACKQVLAGADASVSDMIFYSAVVLVGAAVAGALLMIFLVSSITRPLRRIQNFAEKVAEGDTDVSIEGRFPGELGKLRSAIETMVANLQTQMASAREKEREADIHAEEAVQAKIKAEEKSSEVLQLMERIQAAAERSGEVADNVHDQSRRLTTIIQSAASGAGVQSERIAETAAAMEQMNATVLEVAKNAADAADRAARANNMARDGADVVKQAIEAIGQVNSLSQAMTDNMRRLEESAESIGEVINVISDIADQTNLLALNAAIEAARAGEAGRGFAVVADEVRKLAEKTMNATKEVESAIRTVQDQALKNVEQMSASSQAVDSATSLAKRSGEALEQITSVVTEADERVRSIATASEEQSSASEQIHRALDEIRNVTGEASEGMAQAAGAIEHLGQLSSQLNETIATLKQ
ncbi:MAG: methyl-accepting chemotaxis protein [Desulfovibrionaceae bacterium]